MIFVETNHFSTGARQRRYTLMPLTPTRIADNINILELLRQYNTLAILSGIWFMVQFVRYLFPPLFPLFQRIYGVSNTEVGLLFSTLMLMYAMMQFPSGALSDRFDRSRIITAGTTLFSLAALLIVVVSHYVFILAAAAVIGLGTGSCKTVAINILSRVYSEHQGRALGSMDTVGQFGGVIAPIVIGLVLWLSINWRAAFVLTGIVGLGLAVLNQRRVGAALAAATSKTTDGDDETSVDSEKSCADEPSATEEESKEIHVHDPDTVGDGESYLSAFFDPQFLAFTLASTCRSFAWNGMAAFLPLYLIEQKALDPRLATLVYSSLFLMAVTQLFTGDLSDRFGRLVVIDILFAFIVMAMTALLFLSAPIAILVAVLVLGGGMHGFRPVRSSYFMKMIPDTVSGGTLGLARTLMTSVGAVAPLSIGLLSDRYGYQSAFWTVTGAILAAFCLLLFVTLLDYRS
jgi:MFS family permease